MCLIIDKHITQQRLTEFHTRDKSSWAPALATAVLWADCCDDIHIQAPVAFHWARCMSKILVGFAFFDSVSLFTSAMIKRFTTTQQIILDELSSTRRQLRSSCLTLCHNTPSSFSQPWIYHSNSSWTVQIHGALTMIRLLAGGKWEVWKLSTMQQSEWSPWFRRSMES